MSDARLLIKRIAASEKIPDEYSIINKKGHLYIEWINKSLTVNRARSDPFFLLLVI
jgi:hypothetical protein